MNRATLLALSKDDLVALILAQHAQIEAQSQQIGALTVRIAELEATLAAPPKMPDNSSLPPSKGQKPNLPNRPKKPRRTRPGVARALAEHPDSIIEATLATGPHCAHALGPADQPDIHAYDHIDMPPLRPVVTRINRHRGVCAFIIHLHVTQVIGFQRLARLMAYGIHTIVCVIAIEKPVAMAANCAHPARVVFGPGGL